MKLTRSTISGHFALDGLKCPMLMTTSDRALPGVKYPQANPVHVIEGSSEKNDRLLLLVMNITSGHESFIELFLVSFESKELIVNGVKFFRDLIEILNQSVPDVLRYGSPEVTDYGSV
jgi:hypothetical protein